MGTVVAQPSAMPALHPRSVQLQLGSYCCSLLAPLSLPASCSLKVTWQLRREPGLSALGSRSEGAAPEARAGLGRAGGGRPGQPR